MSEEQQSVIHKIHTPCKKCVFAKYDNGTQTDCFLDYINTYKNSNIEVLEVFDDDLEFYVINDKKCIGYRENSWFAKMGLENASIEEKIKKFHELNKLDYFIVINIVDNDNTSEYLEVLSKEISLLEIKPQKIIFVRYKDTALKYNYDFIINFLKNADLNKCQWRIQTMENKEALYNDTLHSIINLNKYPRFIVSVDLTNKNSSVSFNINEVVNRANKIVYDDLGRFSVISNNEESCILFSGLLYRYSLLSDNQNILVNKNEFIKV